MELWSGYQHVLYTLHVKRNVRSEDNCHVDCIFIYFYF